MHITSLWLTLHIGLHFTVAAGLLISQYWYCNHIGDTFCMQYRYGYWRYFFTYYLAVVMCTS